MTIDFSDPSAVLALNRALLIQMYGLRDWFLPPGYLCPPIPGRADYVHHLADLISGLSKIDAAQPSTILDIGVGANCIYSIIGVIEYGWKFVGTDIDLIALSNSEKIVQANPKLQGMIELRHQRVPTQIFSGVAQSGEHFAACLCNPPFHASARDARAASARKVLNLTGMQSPRPTLNFAGQAAELWCPGGELAFIQRMITESVTHSTLCDWFTVLVSKQAHVGAIKHALSQAKVAELKVVPMSVGQKQTRFVAWRF